MRGLKGISEQGTPLGLGVLGGLAALLFVLARLFVAADGDISQFVVAGSMFGDAEQVDPDIHVFDSVGYDGQFFWRLAVDPAERRMDSHRGVELDQEVRTTRVVYPTIAYVGALGQPELVAWSLVGVNVLMFGALTAAAAAFARDRGHLPVVGLLIAGSSGLLMSMARDLSEVTMVAGIVAGILAIGRERYGWATAAFVVAVATHEQAAYVVLVYGVVRILVMIRGRLRGTGDPPGESMTLSPSLGLPDLPWVGAGFAFVSVQLWMAAVLGEIPLLSSGDNNAALPFMGLLPEMGNWMTGSLEAQEILTLPQLGLVAALVVVAMLGARQVADPDRWLVYALVAGTVFALCLSRNVWVAPAEMRQIVLVPTLAWMVILAKGVAPPRALVGATAAIWLATVAIRVVAI